MLSGHSYRRTPFFRKSSVIDHPCSTGRVEDWAVAPQVRPIHCSPFPLGVPHYPDRELVSSPRHIARSERISRTTRPCTVHIKCYETYQTGATAEIACPYRKPDTPRR